MTGNVGDKLLSRKFWLALSAAVFFAAMRQYAQCAQVVIAYIAVQAGVDAFADYNASRPSAVDSLGGE